MRRAGVLALFLLAGCRIARPQVDGEKVEFIKAGTPAPFDGYLMTPILMARLLEKLEDR